MDSDPKSPKVPGIWYRDGTLVYCLKETGRVGRISPGPELSNQFSVNVSSYYPLNQKGAEELAEIIRDFLNHSPVAPDIDKLGRSAAYASTNSFDPDDNNG